MARHLPVLIVGAGPSGLMMACELKRHGIPFRIIDKKTEPATGSNATWIQTRTLEIFDAIGIVDRFIRKGHRCDTINFYLKGKSVATLPLKHIDSTYPYILMLPQHETEQLLTQILEESHIKVERSLELINLTQDDDGVTATIRLANGDLETITTDWLIGCDGANSTVRTKCQMQFPGQDIKEQFMVADAEMRSPLSANQIHVFFDKGTIFKEKGTLFTAFPWGSKHYRLTANLYQSAPRQNFHEHEVKQVVADRTYGNYVVESVSWISPFWIHSKIVDRMRHQSVFLVGDAAHIHSPAGGQGMNSGIQDAYNLAWKLALVIHKKSQSTLLESYHLERHPVMKHIVEKTDSLTNMVLFEKSFSTKLLKFSKMLTSVKKAKKIGMELTQLDTTYLNSPIIDYDHLQKRKVPSPGERALNIVLSDAKDLNHYLDSTNHTMLVFTGTKATKNHLIKIKELENALQQNFSGLIKILVISPKKLTEFEDVLIDHVGSIYQKYGVKSSAVYIIRPDNMISYYSDTIDPQAVKEFLRKIFI